MSKDWASEPIDGWLVLTQSLPCQDTAYCRNVKERRLGRIPLPPKGGSPLRPTKMTTEKWDTILKWLFTFFMVGVFLGWCSFALWVTEVWLVTNPSAQSVIEAAGLGAVTGALIVWVGLIIQYWFRKKPDYSQKPPS